MKKMYLAIEDEVINKRQKEVKEVNRKIIDSFNKLMFWQKWGRREAIRKLITNNWKLFNNWMEQRIREQQNK